MTFDGPLRTRLDEIAAGTAPSPGTLSLLLPYGYGISAGIAPGEALTVGGRIVTVAAVNFRPCWPSGAVYPWPVADQTLRVVSSSANDDAAPAGTGAWTVRLYWLDANGDEFTTDVALNGVNIVDSAAVTARRLNKAEVVTAGTTGRNEGNITIYATDGATILGYIPATVCATQQAIQTVPRNKKDVFFHWRVAAGFDFIALMARYTTADAFTARFWSRYQGDVSFPAPSKIVQPVILYGGTDYFLQCANIGNVVVASIFGYRLPM